MDLKETTISLSTEAVKVKIMRSKRKSISLQMKGGQFILRAPLFLSDAYLISFLEKHSDWIEKQQEKYKAVTDSAGAEKLPNLPTRSLTAAEKRRVKAFIEERTAYHAKRMGVTYGQIAIRDQKTRWGSCSGKGNLNFNYKIYFMPEHLRDYIIIHELCHRVYMDHSPAFWRLVGTWCPDYKACKEQLKRIVT